MATEEIFQRYIILFFIYQLLIRHGCAVDKYRISIPVFFNTDGIYQESIFNTAVKMFESRNSKDNSDSRKDFEVKMHFSKSGFTNLSSRANGLGSLIPKVSNLTDSSQGVILVDVTESSVGFSTYLESLSIPSIGLFRSQNGYPVTQESSHACGLTRVAAPSVVQYAQTMMAVSKKMGWQSLSLVASTTYDGKQFVDAVNKLSFQEKWTIRMIFWIEGDETFHEIYRGIKNVIESEPGVIIGHIRQRSNEDIFRAIGNLSGIYNRSAWLISDVTSYSTRNISSIPPGVIMVNAKVPEIGQDYELYTKTLYDSFVLFETVFQRSLANLGRDGRQAFSTSGISKCLQRNAIKYLQETYIEGESLLFKEHSLRDPPGSVFIISNLKRDLSGENHWSHVGLATPSGLALEPIMDLNGNTLFPLLHPRRPLLRVPVVIWPPMVQAKAPAMPESQRPCLGRALPCYNYSSVTNSTKQTRKLLCCFGASIDFLQSLQRDLVFDAEIYISPDGQYGKFDPSKNNWTGVVGEIISGKADLALDLSNTMRRAEFVNMIYPNAPTALNILVKKEFSHGEAVSLWFSWLKPFNVDLWIAILVTCNLVLFVVWWLDRKSPKGYFHILKDSDEDAFTLLDSMSYVWGVAFSKDIGAEKSPRSNSARFVSAVYAFLALVMVNTYCANLMAFLVQESPILPISGITDEKLTEKSLYPPDGFKLGITRGTSDEAYFKNHVAEQFRKIYHVNLKIHLFNSFQDGIDQLTSNKLHGMIGDYLSLQQAGNKDPECRYSLAGKNFYKYGYGFAFPKGSPWTEEATLSVLKNQENGSIQGIIDYWFNKKDCNAIPVTKLSFEKFVGLFLLIAGVIGFCFIALISEMLIIFLLIKFGRHLGPLGKFLKRMIFSVRKGEENEIHIKWLQLYKRHRSMRPNQSQRTTANEDSFRRASFCNLSFDYYGEVTNTDSSHEQSLHLGRCQMLHAEKVSGENGNISEPNNINTNMHSRVSNRTPNKISEL